MIKTKSRQNVKPEIKSAGPLAVRGLKVILTKAVAVGSTTEIDRYEWVSGGLFLHYRAGASKTEAIELSGFSS